MEFWTSTISAPSRVSGFATDAETAGWDGFGVVDSQNLSGDPYVCLALGALATKGLGVQTAVTNPVTRHPAATASSAISVQKVSGGRMVLGIGRGDSALAHLGRAPARLGFFERYLITLQAYLRGDEVPFGDTGLTDDMAPTVDNLGLADAPDSSSIHWAGDLPKVPVEVAATGAKVIGIAARHADRIMFALGADPKRLAWGIETARQAAAAAGKDPDTLSYGAYINAVCHDDIEVARDLARSSTSLFARFSIMHGEIAGPADAKQQEVFKNIHDRYDMNAHGQAGGDQTTALTDEFMGSYAIIGSAEHCIDRFTALADLGISKVAVTRPGASMSAPETLEATTKFTTEVISGLRGRGA